MERNTTKGGFWMMIETLDTEPIKEAKTNDAKKDDVRDDEFYPDTSF